ncbi:MAG: hypothetical protein V1494_03975 [Candidatus Diapherotrites archaeon]
MGTITFFLLIFVAALVAGHLLLYATKKGKKGKEAPGEFDASQFIDFGSAPVSHKINLLNERLDRLERVLISAKSSLPENVGEKLESIEKFKSNAEVEIQGIKEVLFELSGKQRQLKKLRSTDRTMEKKLHKIIYRSN